MLAVLLWRLLPEPARGGQSWLYPGAEEIKWAEEATAEGASSGQPDGAGSKTGRRRMRPRQRDRTCVSRGRGTEKRPCQQQVGPPPGPRLLVAQSGGRLCAPNPEQSGAYSSFGPRVFLPGGVTAFAVLFAETRYGISQTMVVFVLVAAGAGGVFGTLYAGRLTDSLIRKGVADARLLVAGVAFVASAAAFLPGAGEQQHPDLGPRFRHRGCLCRHARPAARRRPARRSPSRLWGQAEAVRTFARNILQSFAPLLFGYVSSTFGGPHDGGAASTNPHLEAAAPGRRAFDAFMIMLVPLVAAGVLLLLTRRTYLVDVATATNALAPPPGPTGRRTGKAPAPAPQL